MKESDFSIDEFSDGALSLTCGEGMERDLVFASGAMRGDPLLEEQRAILEYIMAALKAYKEAKK